MVRNPPANAGDVRDAGFLGQKDPLEEDMATHSSILAWRIPVDRGAWRATVHRVAESDTTDSADLACTYQKRLIPDVRLCFSLGVTRGDQEGATNILSLYLGSGNVHVHCEYSLNWTFMNSFYMDVELTSF